MLQHCPDTSQPQVRYFYLPSICGRPAEVIAVHNGDTNIIEIPVPEEDLELHAFFQRSITPTEIKQFGSAPIWRIFNSWTVLETDHQKYKVSPAIMEMLLSCKSSKPLYEYYVVA